MQCSYSLSGAKRHKAVESIFDLPNTSRQISPQLCKEEFQKAEQCAVPAGIKDKTATLTSSTPTPQSAQFLSQVSQGGPYQVHFYFSFSDLGSLI